MCGSVLGLYFVPLVYLSTPVPYCLDLELIVDIWCGKSPTLFFSKNIFVIGNCAVFKRF